MKFKEYEMPDGRKAVFEYDENGVGKITLECMDMLMGLINDRKTENCSEKPNNCETCANGEGDIEACGYCRHGDLYEPMDEPTISKMEQVDKDINVRSKDEPQKDCKSCKHYHEEWFGEECDSCCEYSDWQPKDEPQTEYPRCVVNGTPFDECGFCEQFNCDTCKCEAQTERSE